MKKGLLEFLNTFLIFIPPNMILARANYHSCLRRHHHLQAHIRQIFLKMLILPILKWPNISENAMKWQEILYACYYDRREVIYSFLASIFLIWVRSASYNFGIFLVVTTGTQILVKNQLKYYVQFDGFKEIFANLRYQSVFPTPNNPRSTIFLN